MTDMVERLRKLAEDLIALDIDMRLPPGSLNPHFAADEIERLRLSLSEARATGRREGLSEAANVADAASKEWEADAALWHKEGMLKTAASSLMHSEGAAKVAAAIRAAMEK